MAELDGQEKTEQATSKRLTDTREKGQAPKSQELNSLAVFTTGLLLLFFTKNYLGGTTLVPKYINIFFFR